MKNLILVIAGMFFSLGGIELYGAAKEITVETKKINDAVHWQPETITVAQGDKIKFIVKHELEGGFDFHGFFIPVLKISEQVNRNKPTLVEMTIPSDLKPGEYPIGCQFHPKHVGAKLIVKPAEVKK